MNARTIERRIETELRHFVDLSPAITLLGTRQVGNNTCTQYWRNPVLDLS